MTSEYLIPVYVVDLYFVCNNYKEYPKTFFWVIGISGGK
jgi:hypothetical protein